jgi:hypothetical protein
MNGKKERERGGGCNGGCPIYFISIYQTCKEEELENKLRIYSLERRIYECLAEDVQCDGIQLPATITAEPDQTREQRFLSIDSANLFSYSGVVISEKKRERERKRGKKIRQECTTDSIPPLSLCLEQINNSQLVILWIPLRAIQFIPSDILFLPSSFSAFVFYFDFLVHIFLFIYFFVVFMS